MFLWNAGILGVGEEGVLIAVCYTQVTRTFPFHKFSKS